MIVVLVVCWYFLDILVEVFCYVGVLLVVRLFNCMGVVLYLVEVLVDVVEYYEGVMEVLKLVELELVEYLYLDLVWLEEKIVVVGDVGSEVEVLLY